LFIGNLPWTVTEEAIREVLSPYGQIERVTLQTHADGRPRGFGHVVFASKDQAVTAFNSAAEEPIYIEGRDVVLDYAVNRETVPNTSIYFADFDGDANAIRNILSEQQEDVVDVVFMRDGNTGLPLPSGFVRLNSLEASETALEVLRRVKNADGKSIRVGYARPRPDRDQRKKVVERRPRFGGGEQRQQGGARRKEHYTSRGDEHWASEDKFNRR
jgi:RNA recognition motif-containing protein